MKCRYYYITINNEILSYCDSYFRIPMFTHYPLRGEVFESLHEAEKYVHTHLKHYVNEFELGTTKIVPIEVDKMHLQAQPFNPTKERETHFGIRWTS